MIRPQYIYIFKKGLQVSKYKPCGMITTKWSGRSFVTAIARSFMWIEIWKKCNGKMSVRTIKLMQEKSNPLLDNENRYIGEI